MLVAYTTPSVTSPRRLSKLEIKSLRSFERELMKDTSDPVSSVPSKAVLSSISFNLGPTLVLYLSRTALVDSRLKYSSVLLPRTKSFLQHTGEFV